MPSHRSSAGFGKRQELIAIGGLLRHGFDVYTTLVDDQQIDCIIRIDGNPPAYLDIQIKARSKDAKHPGTFAALEIKNPRRNFFYLFYCEAIDCYWVMPSLDLIKNANRNKTGENAGKYSIVFTNTNSKGLVTARPKWETYRNNFAILASD